MEQQKVLDGNKLIAEFMGMERRNHASYATWENEKGEHIFESVLQYDTSWKWLMPVIEKIESMDSRAVDCRFIIERYECRVYYNTVGMIYEWSNGGTSKINSAFNAATRFIQWYNTQPK